MDKGLHWLFVTALQSSVDYCITFRQEPFLFSDYFLSLRGYGLKSVEYVQLYELKRKPKGENDRFGQKDQNCQN